MCGITGFIDRRQRSSHEELTRLAGAMADAIRHRGPDAQGVWADEQTNTSSRAPTRRPWISSTENCARSSSTCNHVSNRWGHVRSGSDESLGEYVRSQGWEVVATLVTNFPKIIPGRPWKSLRNCVEAMLSTRRPHLAIVCRVA